MNLVIVESPTKAHTISRFLGKNFKVESSFGHVRDLPKGNLGIATEANFEPHYVVPRKVQKQVTLLRKLAAKAERLILATDEDREGEAIAWHLTEVLKANGRNGKAAPELPPTERIVFHEITKPAIEEALKNPRALDTNLVDAQQSRRVLDRLVGYKLSPFLWKKVTRGLSAGRVQSVALRLIVDREEEIKAFKVEEYYTIGATFKKETGSKQVFSAQLIKIGGEALPKPGIKSNAEAQGIEKDLRESAFKVLGVENKETKKNPLPPFITSTLQQTAARHFGYSSKKTMFLAQQLYEHGHITYMRTDSVNLSNDALAQAASWIDEHLGVKYALPAPRRFKTKSKNAQEAHEAIRPTNASAVAASIALGKDHQKLYDLIWRRFVASQLPPALLDITRIEIEAKSKRAGHACLLAAHGSVSRFDGFLKIWPMKIEEKELPELSEGEELALDDVKPEQHCTEPPPRYSEATLIKTLELYGIGRPSTYAPTISVIQERNYVEKQQGRFFPTEIGALVNKVLTENFPEIVDIQFTAKMEDELDGIARGEIEWQNVIREFYDPFAAHLAKKYEEVSKEELVQEKTDLVCEKCGKPMVVKWGRFGKFAACSGYPECKNTKALKDPPREIGLKCPTCGVGEVIERRVSRKGRARGKMFWGCSRYPDCTYASWTNPLEPEKALKGAGKGEQV